MKESVIIIAAIVMAAADPADNRDVQYRIALQRPYTAGESFRVDVVKREKTAAATSRKGELIDARMTQWTVRMDAIFTATEVTPTGSLRKATYTIRSFTADRGEGEQEVLPRGSVVTALYGGDIPAFEVDGKKADDRITAALLQIITGTREGMNDDLMFGSSDAKKIGECWGINADQISRYFESSGITVKKESLRGITCLEKALTHNGVPCLQLRGWLEIRDLIDPRMRVKVTHSTARADFSGIFPIDEKKKCLGSHIVMNMALTGTGPAPDGGSDISVEFSQSQEVTTKVEYP